MGKIFDYVQTFWYNYTVLITKILIFSLVSFGLYYFFDWKLASLFALIFLGFEFPHLLKKLIDENLDLSSRWKYWPQVFLLIMTIITAIFGLFLLWCFTFFVYFISYLLTKE